MALPSMDFEMMNGCGNSVVRTKRNVSEIRLHFLSEAKKRAGKCVYDLLSSKDKGTIQLVIENLENIVEIATGENEDVGYWEAIAKIIKDNGSNVIQ